MVLAMQLHHHNAMPTSRMALRPQVSRPRVLRHLATTTVVAPVLEALLALLRVMRAVPPLRMVPMGMPAHTLLPGLQRRPLQCAGQRGCPRSQRRPQHRRWVPHHRRSKGLH